MSKRTRLLLAAMILFGQVVGALAVPTPAAAQYSYVVDFDDSVTPYTINEGTLTNGVNVGNRPDLNNVLAGRVPTGNTCNSSNNALASVSIAIPSSTLNGISMSAYAVVEGAIPKYLWEVTITDINGATLYSNWGDDWATGWRTLPLGGNSFGQYVPPIVGATNILVRVQACHNTNDRVGIGIISIYTSTPPVTVTPGPTSTPSATDIPPITGTSPCALLGSDAYFSGSRWTAFAPAQIQNGILYVPSMGSAILEAPLVAGRRYEISFIYRMLQAKSDQLFVMMVGDVMLPSIELTASLERQQITLPYATYTPTAEGRWIIELGFIDGTFTTAGNEGPTGGTTDNALQISWFCIKAEPLDEQGTGDLVNEACRGCTYAPVGDIVILRELVGIISWLFCSIRYFLECTIWPAIVGIWNFLGELLLAVVSFIKWVLDTVGGFFAWIGQAVMAVARFLGGLVVNIATAIANFLQQIGLLDLLNGILSFVRDIPIFIFNLLSLAGIFITSAIQAGIAFGQLMVRVVGFVFSAVGYVISIIPLAISAIANGSNTTTCISPQLICDPNSQLYPFCLAFYILDNTIFQSPVAYLLPIVIGVIAIDTVLWVLHKLPEVFE